MTSVASARPVSLRLLFVALVVITLLSAMDATIVATALPSIVADIGGQRQIGWVFAAYTLAMTVAMPVFGRLGDLRGRRALYLWSIAAFVLASVLCGFAADLGQLIALRFVQGVAGGGLVVLGQAVVADAVPARQRAQFMAPIASVFAIASVVSPLLGGGLTDTVGWRWIFWVNAPIGSVALLLAMVSVPRVLPERHGQRLDVPGAALLVVWVTGTALVAAWGGTTFAWTSPVVLGTSALTVVTFALFVRRCLRHPDPIVPLSMFRGRTVVICSALGFVVGVAVFGMVGYLPGLMQAAFGLPATVAGTVILPLVLGILSASIWSGWRTARTGRYRRFPVAGCALAAAGLAGLALVRTSTPPVLVGVCAGLIGLGVGVFGQVTNVAVQEAVPPRLVGTATSTVALVRELGVTLGAAALGGLLAARLLHGLGPLGDLARRSPGQLRQLPRAVRHAYAEAYLSATAPLFAGLAVLFVAGVVVALFLPDRQLGDHVITDADDRHQATYVPDSLPCPRRLRRIGITMDDATLWTGFCTPPDEARPRAWWHWMDGNVDPEGIRLDLEWLQSVGVRGVQMFNGGMGTPLVVPEPVHQGSAAWHDAVRLAATTARELGLEFAVATSAGWSATGGPWVEPRNAMKKVVWSSTHVQGGRAVEQRLADLPDVAGPYQDCVRWGTDPDAHRFSQDWAVVAVPAGAVPTPLTPAAVRTSSPIGDPRCLTDGAYTEFASLPRDPDGPSTAWVEQVFDEPVRVSAVTVGLPGPQGFAAAPPPTAVLEASDDGETYRLVANVDAPGSQYRAVPVRTVAFPPVTARRFRLVLSGRSAAAALPPFSEGIRVPPILRKVAEFRVSEFALFAGGRVHAAEVKAGFAAADDYYALEAPYTAGGAIDPQQVLDLTGCLGTDGVLGWDAPEGDWQVLRFGASLTGQTNGPAPADATGLEVDKLDGGKVRGYLDTYLELFEGVALDALLSDSIEAGPQNHTDRLRERFGELRGYDPGRWLPALAGHVVGDARRTDAFLYDFRRTIADLIAAEYYGTISQEAHRRGLRYYAEALENRRPQLGDDLAMRSHADVPMGAMWLFDADGGSPDPTYLADLKGASSVAHVYGKPFTGAEAMTAFHRPWSYTPKRLKHVADLQFALGVTRFCIHTSPHQPTQVPPPGIGLAPFLGQTFIRTETWAGMAGPWIDYIARCSWLLNQGVPAVDVAVFIGEEAPVTALWGDEPDRSVPPGFDFDYVGLDALEARVSVVDGALAAGDTRYRVLYLGGSSSRMTVRALRRLAALVDDGVTVVGRRPVGSPSLADDEAEHARLCDRLWGGSVLDTDDLGEALDRLGLVPALAVEGAEVLRIGRRVGGREIVFLANPTPEPVTLTLRPAAPDPLVVWDPVTLRRTALDGDRLNLPALGSVFLVPGGAADEPVAAAGNEIALEGAWHLALPGMLQTELPGVPRPWTALGADAVGFAGVGTYATELVMDDQLPEGRTAVLDLGEVGDLARVRVNGVDCGIVWTAPWRVDVTGALRTGANTVEVEVANAWMNRLIAEAGTPTGEIFQPVAEVYLPDAPLQECGLMGPVALRLQG